MAGNLSIPHAFTAASGNVPASQLDNDYIAIRDYVNDREVMVGVIGARPVAGVSGRWYLATDVAGGTLYVDTGTAWVASGAGVTGSAAVVNQLGGMGLSNNGADANNDIDIAAGMAASDDATFANRILMSLVSAITKRLDAAWTVGTNQGGLDVGSKLASTWYHIFVIERTDTAVVDALFSSSALSPIMPTSYTKKRRVGSVRTDTSSNLLAFVQLGEQFLWVTPVLDVNSTNPGASAVTRTLTVPTGIQVQALMNAKTRAGSSADLRLYISPLDTADLAPADATAPLESISASDANDTSANEAAGWLTVRTNTSGQVRSRLSVSSTNDVVRIVTLGWLDRRGQDS